jgi:hypothetical protein
MKRPSQALFVLPVTTAQIRASLDANAGAAPTLANRRLKYAAAESLPAVPVPRPSNASLAR